MLWSSLWQEVLEFIYSGNCSGFKTDKYNMSHDEFVSLNEFIPQVILILIFPEALAEEMNL